MKKKKMSDLILLCAQMMRDYEDGKIELTLLEACDMYRHYILVERLYDKKA